MVTKGVELGYLTNINNSLDYVLDSNNIFQYKILANTEYKSKEINFEPNHRYKIDILDGDNVLNDELINIENYSVNSLNFYSKKDLTDVKNISIDVFDDIDVSGVEKLGYYYEGIDISSNFPTKTINFYNETELIYKDQIITDNSNIRVDLISKQKISDSNYLIVKSKVGIIDQEIVGTKNYIKLTKHFKELREIVNQNNVYLITNTSTLNQEEISDISLDSPMNSILIDQSEVLKF